MKIPKRNMMQLPASALLLSLVTCIGIHASEETQLDAILSIKAQEIEALKTDVLNLEQEMHTLMTENGIISCFLNNLNQIKKETEPSGEELAKEIQEAIHALENRHQKYSIQLAYLASRCSDIESQLSDEDQSQ